jgi:subtilase family serine protease
MNMKRNQIVSCTTLLLCLLPSFMSLLAQRRDRLNASIGGGTFAAVSGSRDPRVDSFADEGALSASEPVTGLGFRFKPSAEQAAKLERLLEDQRNPSSPRYHAWLTPEEYADEFGLSRNDFARVSQWLESQGFRVEASARSRAFLHFSGTAGQVRDSFKTELHRLRANGKTHFANLAEAQVPASLQPLISSFDGLDDFSLVPPPRLKPHFAFDDGTHGLAPADLAAIYNIAPLLAKGYNGAGQKIAVIGASAIRLSDVQQFRDSFGLPPNDPQLILAPGVSDPGRTGFYEQALSDVEIAGSAAPMASILYVYASNPFRGVQYAIDQNLVLVTLNTDDFTSQVIKAFNEKIRPSLKDYLPKREELIGGAYGLFMSTVQMLAKTYGG